MHQILESQKRFFKSGLTRTIKFRIEQLEKLRDGIIKYEEDILNSLKLDLGKPTFEGYATEIGFVLLSIGEAIKNLNSWNKKIKVKSPIYQPGTISYYQYEPYGTVLIMAPFNYPFQLLVEPMIGAIAAGNTMILKPSEHAVQTEKIIGRIIDELYEPEYIYVAIGGSDVADKLIHMPFDYIFFTGSVKIGKLVMKAASENLTPITLELGGKSPVIVHKDANIKIAARRIAWGKFINAGQTCVAPDYVYVHRDREKEFLNALQNSVLEFYGSFPINSPDYCRIINERHMNRLTELIDHGKVIIGGQYDMESRYIAPTIMKDVNWNDAVMQDEIFGPILPVMSYDNLEDVVDVIRDRPKPLAFYVFSENEGIQNLLMEQISFGGGCINDTISHVSNSELPFGGTGSSGMGYYHGKESFITFSHRKSILKKSTKIDIPVVYPPYKNKIKLLKKILKHT